MTPAHIDELLDILQQFFNPREKGWLWLAFYAEDAPFSTPLTCESDDVARY